ncbi:PH domain-containing protein [Streptomyces sp. NPDC049585]|uniref:PH domain-containing protein n=1 Tax=Streptomyces sp. NPDC049585 TaxID=3155154 RepID=UPI00342FD04A
MTSSSSPQAPDVAERSYRSPAGIAGGILLLGLAAWLGGDAMLRGTGNTPWLALAALIFVVPLIIAFTLRPAVWAGTERLLIRNPFRTITLPWGCVEGVRAGYSSEVFAGGTKYQLWAIPVSLRQRKRAARTAARDAATDVTGRASVTAAPLRAPSDQAIDDLRELAERGASREGVPSVRWAYEVIAPAAVGLVLLCALAAVG